MEAASSGGKGVTGAKMAFAWAAFLAFGLFLLTRAYRGVSGDALIYVTRELGRRDPQGLGRDLMFVADTQTGYTIFARIVAVLLDLLSPASTSLVLTLAGLALWFAGAALLARGLASRMAPKTAADDNRSAFAVLAFVAVFPLTYAAFDVLSAAEPMATPRPFAEAFVMAGLAAMLHGRNFAALACGLLAGLFHPLMALGGFAAGLFYLSLQDARWLWLALAGAAAVCLAAWLKVPVAANLFVALDPEWRAVLERRTAYLFPSLWPSAYWSMLGVSAMTLAVAARLTDGPVRQLLVAVLLACAAGLAAAALFGDLWASVLMVQLQPWRVVWIAAVLAPMALAMAALHLWPRGTPERVSLACLALAWICRDTWTIAIPLSLAAWFLLNESDRLRGRMSPLWSRVMWAAVALAALVWTGLPLEALWRSARATPAGFEFERAYLWSVSPLALPVAALAIFMALSRRRWPAMALILPALVIATLAAVSFDDRPRFQIALETSTAPPGLLAALPTDKGPVLWLGGGKESWYWAGRPNWAAAIQGSSIVFSRALATEWGDRARALVALGLEPARLLQPWTADRAGDSSAAVPGSGAISRSDAFAAICARADAPSAIVAPLSEGDLMPPGARIVESSQPAFTLQTSAQGLEWKRTVRYAVHSCAVAARPAH